MSETYVAAPMNDDPWGERSVDHLGFAEDAKAFARLVASKDVQPPLAIAVFGRWGSGKSFFMRLVHDHVRRLSAGDSIPEAPEAPSDSFHRNIVQVRFNAWHYSETNLWASLVDHLFTQLGAHVKDSTSDGKSKNAILDNLSTTRILTIESAERLAAQRKTQQALSNKLAETESERKRLENAVIRRPSTYLDVIQAVFESDPDLKSEIDTAAQAVGIGNVEAAADKLAEQLHATDTLIGEARIAFDSVAVKLGSKLKAALAFACIPAALVLAWVIRLELKAINVPEVWTLLTQTVTSLVVLGGALKAVNHVATPVITKMKAVKAAVESKLSEAIAAYDQKLVSNKEELRKAEALTAAAKQDLAASAAGLVSAVEDFYGSTGTGRLLKFLRARATDGHYAQHLGLVASVRRDFEELSSGMHNQGARAALPPEDLSALRKRLTNLTAPDSPLLDEDRAILKQLESGLEDLAAGNQRLQLPFSRLVLYIDDLDRCAPAKVIEVLQAVHMLLAFPLFAVFVAVDVRWLSRALVDQYGEMLAPSDGAEDKSRAATYDYLEKIFQLPYWIGQVSESSGSTLLTALLPVDEDDAQGSAQTPPPVEDASPTSDSSAASTPASVRSLRFKPLHRELVLRMLPYFARSPRKLLWFVNAAQVLKATSVSISEAHDAQNDFAIITQLALASISSVDFRRWTGELQRSGTQSSLLALLEKRPKWQNEDPDFWKAAAAAAKFADETGFGLVDSEMLLFYAQRAGRFCFNPP